ncbi:MAG: replication-associated recombination protein A [Magnetococcales bacterium]|nr:replication-associated recombination protein A [Magnetococcales bacterium]
MRPRSLAEVLGQRHLIGPGRILSEALAADRIPSLIFWGPPGSGKTTIARIFARETSRRFEALSAVTAGVKEVRAVMERAGEEIRRGGSGTILFVDEIHRFNKGQQDAFLPFVEDGTITLVGASTENPSFHLNGALLSRCRVVVLNALAEGELVTILERAVSDAEEGLGRLPLRLSPELLPTLAKLAEGDGRYALNLLETLVDLTAATIAAGGELGIKELESCLQRRAARHDRDGDFHFNLISALHKSMRGSDPDAALYWLARMLTGGENGLYIARRLIRFASEDIGNADPSALALALHAKDAYHFLGSPEGDLALAQAVVYLATAPKSNSLYRAYGEAQRVAARSGHLSPPLAVLNAPTALMKELGYGKEYRYAHDYEHGFVAQEYLPEELGGSRFYKPVERGFEREIARRLAWWHKLREQSHQPPTTPAGQFPRSDIDASQKDENKVD